MAAAQSSQQIPRCGAAENIVPAAAPLINLNLLPHAAAPFCNTDGPSSRTKRSAVKGSLNSRDPSGYRTQ